MTDQAKKSYAFYEYLTFMWQKKRWLLVIPLATLIIAVIVSAFSKPTYQGTVLFNVADATEDRVTIPDVILLNYQKLLPKGTTLQVIVPKYKQVQVSLSGKDKEQVTKGFQTVVKTYYGDLKQVYKQKVEQSEQYTSTLQQRVDALEKAAKLANPTSANIEAFTSLQNELATRQEQLQSSKIDLANKQEPIIVPPNSLENLALTKMGSSWKANIILGLAFGFILSIVVVTLWKYINDAQRNRRAS